MDPKALNNLILKKYIAAQNDHIKLPLRSQRRRSLIVRQMLAQAKEYAMKHSFTLLVALLLICSHASARDTKHMYPISEAFDSPDYDEKLGDDVKFFFGTQAHPGIAKSFGEYVSNKKTKAFRKSDKVACEWALLSALITFKERALAEGGNAVVNIRSYYKKIEVSSETEFECHAGAIMAGVALKGEVVRLQ
ncbi:MAG: excinuclease [Pseudomonadales bacterium]